MGRVGLVDIQRQIEGWRKSGVIGQLFRFGLTGFAVTAFNACIYWPLATYGNFLIPLGPGAVWPLLAGLIAFLLASAVGHVAHSRFSFKGHGERDAHTAVRFLAVQLMGLALNEAFIWIATGPILHGPTWWSIVPSIFVTPLVTFVLQRTWVFA